MEKDLYKIALIIHRYLCLKSIDSFLNVDHYCNSEVYDEETGLMRNDGYSFTSFCLGFNFKLCHSKEQYELYLYYLDIAAKKYNVRIVESYSNKLRQNVSVLTDHNINLNLK